MMSRVSSTCRATQGSSWLPRPVAASSSQIEIPQLEDTWRCYGISSGSVPRS